MLLVAREQRRSKECRSLLCSRHSRSSQTLPMLDTFSSSTKSPISTPDLCVLLCSNQLDSFSSSWSHSSSAPSVLPSLLFFVSVSLPVPPRHRLDNMARVVSFAFLIRGERSCDHVLFPLDTFPSSAHYPSISRSLQAGYTLSFRDCRRHTSAPCLVRRCRPTFYKSKQHRSFRSFTLMSHERVCLDGDRDRHLLFRHSLRKLSRWLAHICFFSLL